MRGASALVAVAAALAGCGGGGGDGNGDGNGGGQAPAGDPTAGRAIFVEQAEPTCGSCHTLEDAGTTGTVGPNLDDLQPGAEQVEQAVRSGPGVMPSYDGQLSDQEISDLAQYVADAAG